jgi:hypothetical protein
VGGRHRRIVAPEGVDQIFTRYRVIPTEQQIRQEKALLSAPERRHGTAGFERPEQAELEHCQGR